MNDLGGFIARVATATVVRRVVGLLLLAVLAWAGTGRAEAACTGSGNTWTCANKAEAAAKMSEISAGWSAPAKCAALGYQRDALPTANYYVDTSRELIDFRLALWCDVNTSASFSSFTNPINLDVNYSVGCPQYTAWNSATHTCDDTRCTLGRDLGIWTPNILDDLACETTNDGANCEVAGVTGPDGYVHWYATGDQCTKPYTCPTGYFSNGDGTCEKKTVCPEGVPYDLETNSCAPPEKCPPGSRQLPDGSCKVDDDSNCTAGQVKGPDGLCMNDPDKCSAGSAPGADGTCKPDSDGDGVPDVEDGDHHATDSASCASPPVCSGDQILCVHAMQLWRIDCNTRRNANVDLDMYCKRPPVCESVALGDDNRTAGCTQQEEAMIFLQWKTACAVAAMAEKDAEGGGPTSGDDANGNGQPDWTENPGDGTQGVNLGDDDTDGSGRASIIKEGASYGGDGLDVSGMGFVRTCPTIPDVTVRGTVIHFNTDAFCGWMQLGGQFVLLLAALLSVKILTNGSGM